MSLGNASEKTKGKQIFACGLFLIAAAGILYYGFVMAGGRSQKQTTLQTVYVVDRTLPKGKAVTGSSVEELFRLEAVDKSLVPEDAFLEGDLIPDGYAAVGLTKNTIVTRNMIQENNRLTAEFRHPVMAAVVANDAASTVGGCLKKGDRVNLYFLMDGEELGRMEGLPVAEVFDVSGKDLAEGEKQGNVSRFNVYMEEDKAASFYKLSQISQIRAIRLEDS